MRIPPDLHPHDTAARARLAAELAAIRRNAKLSQRALAKRLNVTQSFICHMEAGQASTVALWQRWARGLDRRLILDVCGLVVPDDGDVLAAVYDAQQPADPAAQDLLELRRTVNNLARIRRARMTSAQLGARIDVDERAVIWRETHPDGALLASVQQMTRALDGWLSAGLIPVGVSHAVM